MTHQTLVDVSVQTLRDKKNVNNTDRQTDAWRGNMMNNKKIKT